MTTFVWFTLTSLLLLSHPLVRAEVACNFVRLTVSIEVNEYLQNTLGTFSLSTNRCQSLHAMVDYYVDTANVDGSMEFSCSDNGDDLIMNFYSDATCNKLASSQTVSADEELTLFEYLHFKIDDLHCDKLTCEVGFTFAKNCTWIQSPLYLNASLPPEQCLSFGADFQGLLTESIPDQILPEGVVNNLDSKSYKYSCCDDGSLLMYNYTDTTCQDEAENDAIRISPDYNGTCFKVYGDASIFSQEQHKEHGEKDLYRFVLSWTCAKKANCDGIDFLDDSFFPNECEDGCLNGLHWVSGGSGSDSGDDKGSITLSKDTVIAACVGVLILFILCVIGVYYTTRHRRIKQEVEKDTEIIVSAEKYAPMIEDDDLSTQVEYVANDDNGTDDEMNINNTNITTSGNDDNNTTTKRTFAAMTASMTIDNVVMQDDNNNNNVVNGDNLNNDATEPLTAGGSGIPPPSDDVTNGDVVEAPLTQRDEDGI